MRLGMGIGIGGDSAQGPVRDPLTYSTNTHVSMPEEDQRARNYAFKNVFSTTARSSIMKTTRDDLPESLKRVIENGGTVFRGDDADWDIRVESVSDTPFKNDFPSDALIIANNGCGDCLFIRKTTPDAMSYAPEVYVYWHEERCYEKHSDDIENLTHPEPVNPSKHKAIFYFGGKIEVKLGDEVSARDILFRRNGRIVYVPGVSNKNRNMEHGGLSWVGIKFERGTFGGSVVDPGTSQLKKSVRFLQRSSKIIEEFDLDEYLD